MDKDTKIVSRVAAVTTDQIEGEHVMVFPDAETLEDAMNKAPFVTPEGYTLYTVRPIDGEEAAEIGAL